MDNMTSIIAEYAKQLAEKEYISCGFVAAKEGDGIYITKPNIDFLNISDDDVIYVTDKTIEALEENFRAAAVILFCAIKQDNNAGAAAIVDSKSILEFSKRQKTLKPILDDLAQINGISIKSAKQNTAADVVACLSGLRNSCFMKDAGAVVTGRTLSEVFTATLVLDKACNAEILAENKGGTTAHSVVNAVLEHVVYKLKYSKSNQKEQKAKESGHQSETEHKASAIITDKEVEIATEITKYGVKLLEENLVQGTWGNIGVKIDDKTMLATPSGIDYEMLKPEQMAKVNMDTLEWTGSNKATSEKGIHAVLLKANAETTATIHTHPFFGSILSAMGKELVVPEKYRAVLGDKIPCAKPALPGTKALVKNAENAIGTAKACFMQNHGIIVRGRDLEDAFNICKALEDACRDYLLDVE